MPHALTDSVYHRIDQVALFVCVHALFCAAPLGRLFLAPCRLCRGIVVEHGAVQNLDGV
jgi:hypothetical protein